MALFMATGLVPAKWAMNAHAGLRLFLVVAVALSCAMMASHRWSHTMPSKLAPPSAGCRVGVLLTTTRTRSTTSTTT